MPKSDNTEATTRGEKPKRPAAQGMRRARDKYTGILLKHGKDDGRAYESRMGGYYLCATCDAEGRDALITYNELSLEVPSHKALKNGEVA